MKTNSLLTENSTKLKLKDLSVFKILASLFLEILLFISTMFFGIMCEYTICIVAFVFLLISFLFFPIQKKSAL